MPRSTVLFTGVATLDPVETFTIPVDVAFAEIDPASPQDLLVETDGDLKITSHLDLSVSPGPRFTRLGVSVRALMNDP